MQRAPVQAPKKIKMAMSWRMGCLVAWAFGLMCLLAVAVVLFVVRPDPSQWLAALKPKSACDPAQLSIGGMTFRIQELARSADGSIPFPADSQGAAYWIEGTTPHYVFALSPAMENLKLAASVKPGDAARITWTDCSSAVYSLRAVEVTSSHAPELFDKTGTGLTIFVQADASGRGVALRSELVQAFAAPTAASAPTEAAVNPAEPVAPVVPGQPLQTFQPPTSTAGPTNTPIPPPSENKIEAEIGFMGKEVTDSTITINISVYNYGAKDFSIKKSDAHLLLPPMRSISPSSVDPALPYKVESQASQDFTFTFPNPGGNGIVFKLLNVEFNLDDY